MGRGAKPAKAKVAPRPSVARKSRQVDGSTARQLEQRLTEALEQQAATSEILRVISRSRDDVQPVFDIIAERAVRLCNAEVGIVSRLDGARIELAALYGVVPQGVEVVRSWFPMQLTAETVTARVVRGRAVVHVADVLADPTYESKDAARAAHFRGCLGVPMLREGQVIGSIFVARAKPGLFAEAQVELLKTFADQAVIAVENVRLFNEVGSRNRDLTEALEQQTATSDVLRVISQSPTDVQPVFDAIARDAVRLCDATYSVIGRYDGQLLHLVAHEHVRAEGVQAMLQLFPMRPSRATTSSRAVLDRAVVHVPDVLEDPDYDQPVALGIQNRSTLAVPMMRDGHPIGTISVGRLEPQPFSDKQIALLQTFADQAVIAIENVRLFKELETRNRDLTEALEQQTATSEILRVISRSQTDVQPVFETIVAAALKLCRADSATVLTFDGTLVQIAALANTTAEGAAALRRSYPRPLGRDNAASRALLTRSVVAIPDVLEDPEYAIKDAAVAGGFRSAVSIPLIREASPIGTVNVGRREPGPFPDKQIALLQTFADQAVIAIENVRLFKELEARNRDLTEALEQQTSTSDILRVISQSPTDVQPVFDTIAAAALKLCRASSGAVMTFDGELIHLAAVANLNPEGADAIRKVFPRPPGRDMAATRAILTCSVVAISDVLEDHEFGPSGVAVATGFRSVLAVPLIRNGSPIGAIAVGRPEPGPFPDKQIALLQTFADQAVIAIENVRLFKELETRNRDLTEALEQQTATSDILRVISQSPTDVQPVFDTIAAAALKLCRASSAVVTTFDGELLRLAAVANVSPEGADAVRHRYPRPPGRGNAASRAVLTRSVVAIPDVLEEPEYDIKAPLVEAGFRSVLAVPLMREENPIGAITVVRPEPGLFPDKQIALLQTFADQAVIAIENVRLFTELETRNRDVTEALEQQTATSDILRVISQSRTDAQPVFETIAVAALKLCRASSAHVAMFDGELIHLAAFANFTPELADALRQIFPRPPSRDTGSSRAVLTGGVVAIPDVLEDPEYALAANAVAGGYRSVLAVPLIREGSPIGAIGVARPEPGPFPDSQIALLQTFADQAVIAIENVRLFKELETRNRDLTEALEQQTATSDILRVISQSQTDVQPVFDTIAGAAQKLCNASSGLVFTFDGKLIHLAAIANLDPAGADAWRNAFPRPPSRDTASTRAVLTRSIVAIPDVLEDPDYVIGPAAASTGFRSALAVPLMREGNPIGVVGVGRTEPGPFPDKQIALLKTFADQAMIAIENARLFKELEARTTDLTRSVGELKALGEVGQAVSSTLDLETVLNTIVSRATQLAGMDGGSIWEYDEAREEFYLHATDKLPDELVEALRATPIKRGEGAVGRLAVTGEPVEIRDIVDEGVYQSRVREILIRLGYRSLLAVPLLREDHLLGGLAVNRKSAGEFAPEVIDLLKTFATQSALAIQNARLFREIETKSRELEIASQHKSEFLANMSHELRTPLNAIIGFSEVLSERMFGEVNVKQAEYLSDILESGRHLLSLINDILDLSKIEAGRMELEPSEFDLPTAIENTLILVRERAQRRGIALGRTVDERLGTIRADERKVKQVLLNLLSNALKFTPEGGRIDVVAGLHDGVTEISVTDTGVGIAPEDQEAVFEEFRQVGPAARMVEGTGLGLAISRKFIELHGGRIWVKSQPGIGSTFAFTLPLTIDQPHPTG